MKRPTMKRSFTPLPWIVLFAIILVLRVAFQSNQLVQHPSVNNDNIDSASNVNVLSAEANKRLVLASMPLCKISQVERFDFLSCSNALPTEFFTRGAENDLRIILHRVLVEKTKTSSNKIPLVLDLGCNTGFFSMYSAHVGARSICFEFQPKCLEIINAQIKMLGFEDKVSLMTFGLGNKDATALMDFSEKCSGHTTFEAKNIRDSLDDRETIKKKVSIFRLDNLIAPMISTWEDVDFFKLDTEGSEIEIMLGATHLFESGKIRYACIEVSPQWWRRKNPHLPDGGVAIGVDVLKAWQQKYAVFAMQDNYYNSKSVEKFKSEEEIKKECGTLCVGLTGLYRILDMELLIRDKVKAKSGMNLLFIRTDLVGLL